MTSDEGVEMATLYELRLLYERLREAKIEVDRSERALSFHIMFIRDIGKFSELSNILLKKMNMVRERMEYIENE